MKYNKNKEGITSIKLADITPLLPRNVILESSDFLRIRSWTSPLTISSGPNGQDDKKWHRQLNRDLTISYPH